MIFIYLINDSSSGNDAVDDRGKAEVRSKGRLLCVDKAK